MSDPTLSDGDVKVLSRIAGREMAAANLLSHSQGQYLDFFFGSLTADEIRHASSFGVKCSYTALYGASPTATQSQVLTRRLSRLEECGLIVCHRNPDSPRRHLAEVTTRGHELLGVREMPPMPIVILPKHQTNLPDWLSDYLSHPTNKSLPV